RRPASKRLLRLYRWGNGRKARTLADTVWTRFPSGKHHYLAQMAFSVLFLAFVPDACLASCFSRARTQDRSSTSGRGKTPAGSGSSSAPLPIRSSGGAS
ncbi:MAG: hypothetical protein OJI67_24190, partial [Prosthecobacter sp.]|nr:hypothetical protein [Prosthecobacter sp.]